MHLYIGSDKRAGAADSDLSFTNTCTVIAPTATATVTSNTIHGINEGTVLAVRLCRERERLGRDHSLFEFRRKTNVVERQVDGSDGRKLSRRPLQVDHLARCPYAWCPLECTAKLLFAQRAVVGALKVVHFTVIAHSRRSFTFGLRQRRYPLETELRTSGRRRCFRIQAAVRMRGLVEVRPTKGITPKIAHKGRKAR